jgi:hypothetical protein
MHDAAKDFQADFIVANLDPLRALPILRVPGTGVNAERTFLKSAEVNVPRCGHG